MPRKTDTTAAKTDTTATLLDDIGAFITKYVTLASDNEKLMLALWVLHTWTFSPEVPHPYTTPYLYIYSAEKQSGKTRLLEVLETIIRNPSRAANLTEPVMFREIEASQTTLLIDEVDAIWSGAKNEGMRGLLNSGYKRGGKAKRIENREVRDFNVFAPKALAGIDNNLLPDTVYDRCIPIHMHRQKVGTTQPFYSFAVEPEAEALRDRIHAWVNTDWLKLSADMPVPFTEIGDRAFEISMPLLQISKGFRNGYVNTKKALIVLLNRETKMDAKTQMLADIRELFDREKADKLPSATIIAHLNGDDGKGGWTQKLLASRLQPYGVKGSTIRHKNEVMRGYRRADFTDAWERYL